MTCPNIDSFTKSNCVVHSFILPEKSFVILIMKSSNKRSQNNKIYILYNVMSHDYFSIYSLSYSKAKRRPFARKQLYVGYYSSIPTFSIFWVIFINCICSKLLLFRLLAAMEIYFYCTML